MLLKKVDNVIIKNNKFTLKIITKERQAVIMIFVKINIRTNQPANSF